MQKVFLPNFCGRKATERPFQLTTIPYVSGEGVLALENLAAFEAL